MQNLVPQNQSLLQNLFDNAGIENRSKENSWDHLEYLSNSARDKIISSTGTVLQARDFLIQMDAFEGEPVVLVNGIMKEIEIFSTQWKNNRVKHEGKTGYGSTTDDFNTIRDIGIDYIQGFEEMLLAISRILPRLQEIVTLKEIECRNAEQAKIASEITVSEGI